MNKIIIKKIYEKASANEVSSFSTDDIFINNEFLVKKIVKKGFVEEDNKIKILCILSALSYNYNTLFDEINLNLGLKGDLYIEDERLVYLVFVMNGCLIVSFKGSSDIHDFITNIDFTTTNAFFNIPGKVHSGFYNLLFKKNRYSRIMDVINIYPKYMPIYITGHSLGAGVGTLFFNYLKYNSNRKINLVTFGSPRVGNSEFSKSINTPFKFVRNLELVSTSIRVVNGSDLVSKIPLPIGYRHNNEAKRIKKNNFFKFSLKDHAISRYFDSLTKTDKLENL